MASNSIAKQLLFSELKKVTARTNSINFHRDGHPPFTYKLMVYLTDVTEKSGAFAFKPNSNAKIIIPKFGAHNYKRGFEAENYRNLSLFGDAGHTILFKNNALHAGGRTTEGERIVVTFLLHPRYLSSQDNHLMLLIGQLVQKNTHYFDSRHIYLFFDERKLL